MHQSCSHHGCHCTRTVACTLAQACSRWEGPLGLSPQLLSCTRRDPCLLPQHCPTQWRELSSSLLSPSPADRYQAALTQAAPGSPGSWPKPRKLLKRLQ